MLHVSWGGMKSSLRHYNVAMITRLKRPMGPSRSFLPLRLTLLLLLSAASCGCSSFGSKWDSLESQPLASEGIGGRWEGKWISEVSGHEGRLRCIIDRKEEASTIPLGPGDYRFSFSATWGPGIVSDYDIEMKVQKAGDEGMSFEGDMHLGALMGVYRCKGRIIGDRFEATYASEQDHGTFQMSRPVK